jgi:hypothetical protein
LLRVLDSLNSEQQPLDALFASELAQQEPERSQVGFVRMAEISDLSDEWLAFWQRHFPAVMREEWWRSRQPMGSNVRLGIRVQPDAQRKRLLVTAVHPQRPAAGILEVGDFIIGVQAQRLTGDKPVAEVRSAMRRRPNARWVELMIERDGEELAVKVPLPFVNPVRLLERVAALGRIVGPVVYADDLSEVQRPKTYLSVELQPHAFQRMQASTGVATKTSETSGRSELDVSPDESPGRNREN